MVEGKTITAATPPLRPGPVNVSVVNPNGQTGTLITGYKYLASPAIASVETVGKALVVHGSGFQKLATVLIDNAEFAGSDDGVGSTITVPNLRKTVHRGQTVVVRVKNPGGILSDPFPYSRPQL